MRLMWVVLFLLSFTAWGAPFHGLPYREHRMRNADGSEVIQYEILANEDGQVVEFKPGFMQTAQGVDDRVLDLVHAKKKVLVSQVRLAGRGPYLGGRGSHGGTSDDLEQVMRVDSLALTRKAIEIAGDRKINGVGFSMGVDLWISLFSDPKIAAEIAPHIETLTLIGGPHNFHNLPKKIRAVAWGTLKLLESARNMLDRDTIEIHTSLFDFTLKLKRSGNPALVALAHSIEKGFMTIGNLVLKGALIDMEHTSAKALSQVWTKDVSVLPLDRLIAFARAAVRGEILDRNGRPLVVPERVSVPTQIVSSTDDMLAPMPQQEELMRRVGADFDILKRAIVIEGWKHITATHGDAEEIDFMDHVIDFMENPSQVVATTPRVLELDPFEKCKAPLTQRAWTAVKSLIKRH